MIAHRGGGARRGACPSPEIQKYAGAKDNLKHEKRKIVRGAHIVCNETDLGAPT